MFARTPGGFRTWEQSAALGANLATQILSLFSEPAFLPMSLKQLATMMPAAMERGSVWAPQEPRAESLGPTTQFIDARSMSCRGKGTCVQLWATLSKDLYCSQYSGVGQSGDTVCSSSSNIFTFFSSAANPTHCVSCLGENANANGVICKDSTFNFNSMGANVKMICDSKDGCQAAKVNIADSATCLELNCKAGSTGPTLTKCFHCQGTCRKFWKR